MPYITSGSDYSARSGEVPSDPPSREAVAFVDSQIVNAHWRWLHARWAEDSEESERAMIAIDLLLDRRFEIMQALDAA